jgi:hypothetical protein
MLSSDSSVYKWPVSFLSGWELHWLLRSFAMLSVVKLYVPTGMMKMIRKEASEGNHEHPDRDSN